MIYRATQAIADVCKLFDIPCEVIEHAQVSAVKVNMALDTTNISMLFISYDDDNSVAMRINNLAKMPEHRIKNRVRLLEAVNQANIDYRFIKFCLSKDNEVSVEGDFPKSTTDAGKTAMEYIVHMGRLIDVVYPEIMKAIWLDEFCDEDAEGDNDEDADDENGRNTSDEVFRHLLEMINRNQGGNADDDDDTDDEDEE